MRGMNYRLTNIQAAIGLAQTAKIDFAVARKREIAAAYLAELRDFEHVTLPVERPGCKSVYWMFGVLINDSFGRTKEDVMAALRERVAVAITWAAACTPGGSSISRTADSLC
jgi:perosamine synthetase